MNKEQVIYELNQFTKAEIIKAIADTDSILAERITSKLVRQRQKAIETKAIETDEQLETLIKLLSLPKESQDKILKDATDLAKKLFDFLQKELEKTLNT